MKALRSGADILILDEPTAVLTPQESKRLFAVLRRLAGEGRTVLLVTHKLKEVLGSPTGSAPCAPAASSPQSTPRQPMRRASPS
jgi:ABC-type molybdenum transport system ATPase subunit/photorepair protein PhrA